MDEKIDYSKYIKYILFEVIKFRNNQEDNELSSQSSVLKSLREKRPGNWFAASFRNTLSDKFYSKLFPYLYHKFEPLGTTSGEFLYISVYLTNLVGFLKPQNIKSDIKTIHEALHNPYIQDNETVKSEIQSLYELLKLLDLSNSIAHIICVMRSCIRMGDEKSKAVIISEILNTLLIYEKYPFLTIEEADKEADRLHRKKISKGKKIDKFKDGPTIIYERMKYYYSAELLAFHKILKFYDDSIYFKEFIKQA